MKGKFNKSNLDLREFVDEKRKKKFKVKFGLEHFSVL